MDLSRRTFVIASATAAACACLGESAQAAESTGTLDVGTPADYAPNSVVDTWAKPNKVLVVRNGNRIYATTAKCTHKSCTLRVKNNAIACPCHSSKFTHDGVPTGGPAKTSLSRYKITLQNGRLIVDPTKSFGEKQWDAPESFVTV